MRTVIAAYDNSGAAHGGLQLAVRIAVATGARLLITHAVKPLRREKEAHSVADLVETDTRERCEEWERRLAFATQDAEEQAKSLGKRLEVTTELLVGPPAERLSDLAEREHADLLVAGTHGIGHMRQMLFGSVSQRLLEQAPCDVLFSREPLSDGTVPQVIVGCDGSDWARRAADVGSELAEGLGSKLVLLHVSPYQAPFADSPFLSEESRESMRSDLHARGVRILQEFRERLNTGSAEIEEVVREGHIRGEFLEECEARTPSIAVVGTRGESGVKDLIVGSVTRTLLDHCRCPVLVVRLPQTAATA